MGSAVKNEGPRCRESEGRRVKHQWPEKASAPLRSLLNASPRDRGETLRLIIMEQENAIGCDVNIVMLCT